MTINIDFTQELGLANIYGQSMLFHCNHYNRSLQETIEDAVMVDSENIFLQSAAETVFLQCKEYFSQNPGLSFSEKLEFGANMFQFAGFGRIDFSQFSAAGGKIIVTSSHFGEAVKLNLGKRTKPAEYFDKGFIAGLLCTIQEELEGDLKNGFVLEQTSSISMNDDACIYEVKAGDYQWLKYLDEKELPEFAVAPARAIENNIDEDTIVGALASMDIIGGEDGLIPAFGVYLTRMYADYYNKISFRFAKEIADSGMIELAEEMLVEAGHICAFNTFGGIMTSMEWDGLIKPMIQNREDWVHGIVACANALGWGVWRVAELIPNEKLVMRVYRPYESVGHLRWFGKAEHPTDYLVTGGCSGIMNLLYYGDITKKPDLDKQLYAKLFRSKDGFHAKQTKCVAQGDEYSEFVVTKK